MIDSNQETSIHLLKLTYQKRKLFLLTFIIAVITGVVVTFITPKKFTSTGIVYAVNTNSYDRIIENPAFGDEDDADQLIQLFQSARVKDQIISTFNLIDYYEVDTTDPKWQYYVYKYYDGDITFNRTRYSSIEITATTKDPVLSANIVNKLIDLIDVEREKIYQSNVQHIVDHFQNEFDTKNTRVNHILDTLFAYSNTGNSANSNNPLFKNRQMFMDERQKNTHIFPGDAAIKSIGANYQTKKVEQLINEYYFLQGRLNYYRERLDMAKNKLKLPSAKIYKVSRAKPVYKKSSPKLSINLIGFCLTAFVLTLLFILVKHQIRYLKES